MEKESIIVRYSKHEQTVIGSNNMMNQNQLILQIVLDGLMLLELKNCKT